MSEELREIACRDYFGSDYVAPDDPNGRPYIVAACTAFRVGWRYCAGWVISQIRVSQEQLDEAHRQGREEAAQAIERMRDSVLKGNETNDRSYNLRIRNSHAEWLNAAIDLARDPSINDPEVAL